MLPWFKNERTPHLASWHQVTTNGSCESFPNIDTRHPTNLLTFGNIRTCSRYLRSHISSRTAHIMPHHTKVLFRKNRHQNPQRLCRRSDPFLDHRCGMVARFLQECSIAAMSSRINFPPSVLPRRNTIAHP